MKTISMLTAFIKFVSSEIYSPRRIICRLKKIFNRMKSLRISRIQLFQTIYT